MHDFWSNRKKRLCRLGNFSSLGVLGRGIHIFLRLGKKTSSFMDFGHQDAAILGGAWVCRA